MLASGHSSRQFTPAEPEQGPEIHRRKLAHEEDPVAVAPSPEEVVETGLVYVSDEMPGIRRERRGKGFAYYDPDGNLVKDRRVIDRIKKLAIPPAYTDVWICPIENGHLQATGRDARGRKQYRYHPQWTELTNENKFSRMLEFGAALPAIRERVDQDLAKRGLPREKVLASVVWFLEKSLIRVGNDEYAKTNRSFGLTTLRRRHAQVEGSVIQFKFTGKRGLKHHIRLADRRMARLVRKLQEIPAQELFCYEDEAGNIRDVTSTDVNNYLREITGQDFTAKDFRTWSATVAALAHLCGCCGYASVRQAKSSVSAAMKEVAQKLGNTPAICRKSYVHPRVVNGFLDGSLEKFLESRAAQFGETPIEDCAEAMVLELLREIQAEQEQAA
jgi:DNA topoisomerase I